MKSNLPKISEKGISYSRFCRSCPRKICCAWCNGSTADCGSVGDSSNLSVQPIWVFAVF